LNISKSKFFPLTLSLLLMGCTLAEKKTEPRPSPLEKIEKLVLKEGNGAVEWTVTADLLTRKSKEQSIYAIVHPIVTWKNWGKLTGKKGTISANEIKIEDCLLIRNDKKIISKEIIFKKTEKSLYIPYFYLESKQTKLNGSNSVLNLSNKKLLFKHGRGKYVY